jgi:hypothetical protein
VLDNLDALEFIADALPSGSNLNDALASHFFNNGDDIQGNILLPDYIKEQPDSDYGVGISFRNSEIRKFPYPSGRWTAVDAIPDGALATKPYSRLF